jgi:hypothetical protein
MVCRGGGREGGFHALVDRWLYPVGRGTRSKERAVDVSHGHVYNSGAA